MDLEFVLAAICLWYRDLQLVYLHLAPMKTYQILLFLGPHGRCQRMPTLNIDRLYRNSQLVSMAVANVRVLCCNLFFCLAYFENYYQIRFFSLLFAYTVPILS